jgi:hypothetical protein
MMDYLRRLAPAREISATRAVAVLPSRFASAGPLRNTVAQARSSHRPDDDEAPPSVDAPSAYARHADSVGETQGFVAPAPAEPMQTHAAFAPHHLASDKQLRQTMRAPFGLPGRPDTRATQRGIGKATAPPHLQAGEHNTGTADSFILHDQEGAHSKRSPLALGQQRGAAKALQADHFFRGDTASPSRPHAALPLSQQALAQRTNNERDDSQVVHVTIGRIDVVANTAPAPTVRHSPAPRQATVTLTDYLRGGKVGRQ